MNTKRILFWLGFAVIIGLIVWGLIAAGNKEPREFNPVSGTPAPITEADNLFGSADADVTIIEYSDFQCPACAFYSKVLKQLVLDQAMSATSSPLVRLVYRHFPLPGHANSMVAAQSAEAAGVQGKFWEFSNELFDNQDDWATEEDPMPIFEKYATGLGLDLAKFQSDVKSDAVKARVKRDLDESQKLDLRATPSFFVNGKFINNPPSYEAFKEIIRTAAKDGSN